MSMLKRVLKDRTEKRLATWIGVLRAADHEARSAGHARVGSEHLLLALVAAGGGRGARWLRENGSNVGELRHQIRQAVDARGGDPQQVAPNDLRAAGLGHLDIPAGARDLASIPPRGRTAFKRMARDHRMTPEALAVIDTATEHAHARAQLQPREERQLVDDDLAFGLAMTRGTRAYDLLREHGLEPAELRDAVAPT